MGSGKISFRKWQLNWELKDEQDLTRWKDILRKMENIFSHKTLGISIFLDLSLKSQNKV